MSMTDEPITVIAGLGRCGSSMLCQMLIAGGMEATGSAEPPFWEDPRCTWLPHETDWLDECRGKVVKLLGISKMTPPAGKSYRWIWLSRNKAEQVKSQHKTAEWLKRQRRGMDIKRETVECLAVIAKLGGPLLHLRYEEIVDEHDTAKAAAAAVALNEFCGGKLKVAPMIEVVRKRSPKCAKVMEEGRDFYDEPRDLVEKEQAEKDGVINRKCGVKTANGQPCGAQWGHEGKHTWAAEPLDMLVFITPAQVLKMTGACPGCGYVLDEIVHPKIGFAIQNGHNVASQCGQCGQRTITKRRNVLEAKSMPKIEVVKH